MVLAYGSGTSAYPAVLALAWPLFAGSVNGTPSGLATIQAANGGNAGQTP
jgi:hypothetical protein